MCNVIVQDGVVIKAGQTVMVQMRGPAGDWLMPMKALWIGSARRESNRFWKKQGGIEVIVPKVGAWGEVDGAKAEWENLPEGAAVRAIMLPLQEPKTSGKEPYRPLKMITCAAIGEQLGRFQNDRAVEVELNVPDVPLPPREQPAQGELF
jgi:hypothetical protein